MNRKITLILPLLLLGFIFNAKAQCPANIDWELGSYSNWVYYTGSCCPISVPTPGWVAGRHTLTTGPGTDPYGGFPVVAPGGGSYSFKLGNDGTGSQAERARYYVPIPTGGIYSLIYRYAVVLNDPSHATAEQPRMVVSASDSNTGASVACAQYTYIASGSIPGFLTSPLSAGGGPVYYKTWTMGNMKFPGIGGHTAIVDFTTADCGYGGHFGYGYIDMTCGLFANQIIGCASGTTVLAGPDGYQSYVWKDSATYSITYGTSAVVVITAPTVTTTYAVILTPYTGYGCVDTLFTRVVPATLALNAGNDTSICSGTTITLTSGATSTAMPISYSWSPSTGLACPTCANPLATPSVTTSYTVTAVDAAGCIKTDAINVTVYPTPTAIVGPSSLCPSETVTYSASGASGASWVASPTSVATINPSTGALTGIVAGTVTVTAMTGPFGVCSLSRVVTVNPLPASISGASRVCVGQCITWTDATSGGVWSDPSYTAIATVGSSTGVVCGVAAGSALITYAITATGCKVTKSVTVDPVPTSVAGFSTVCVGQTITLFGTPTGGTWSSSGGTGSVTVNSTSGDVTGVSPGPVTIVYSLSSGCSLTKVITVNPLPAPITGPDHVCVGGSITLTDTDPTGTWSATNANAGVSGAGGTGVVTGATAGVDTILYTTAGGCAASYVITIDPIPAAIVGPATVCVGDYALYSDVDPGTWSMTPTTRGTINPTSGVVTGIAAGAATVTLTSPYGCVRTLNITVIAQPNPITGSLTMCVGTSSVLSSTTIPGSFTMACPSIATVTPTGIVTGVGMGSCTVTYTHTPSGCKTFATVTVNTSPGPIAGNAPICLGQSITVSNLVSGGTWSITPTTVATVTPIGAASASVTGVGTSTTATLTYSLGAGCSITAIITVNPLPSVITGTPSLIICQGTNTTLGSTPGGGTWSTTATSLITLNSTSGAVTGVGAGVATVTYTAPTGCQRTGQVTVNPIPLPIGGPTQVCVGNCITLTCSTGGGTWSSLTPAIGTINSTTGSFCGVATAGGVATVKYTLTSSSCARTTTVNVSPLPNSFTLSASGGITAVCAGSAGVTLCLSGSQVGVSYQLKNGATNAGSPINGTGSSICFPPQTTSGVYTVEATNAAGCTRSMSGSVTLTVFPIPTIVGPSAVCNLATGTLTATPAGGTWSSGTLGCITIGASTGLMTGVGGTGCTSLITYTAPSSAGSCQATRTVSVSPSPTSITIPRGVCAADTVTVFSTPAGGTWTTGSTCVSINPASGLVTGVSGPCAAPLTYSLGSGCTVTNTINVTPQPAPIAGPGAVCEGSTISVSDLTPGGVWAVAPSSSSYISITPSGTTCTVLGLGGGAGSSVVATIYYISSGGTGCSITKSITVNPMPTSFGGPNQVCQGSSITLTSTPGGGSWGIMSGGGSATITTATPTSAVLSAGLGGSTAVAVTVGYTAAGCTRTGIVTVNPLPTAITGASRVCQGSQVTLNATPATGSWTTSSTTSALASVTSPSPGVGVVTGVSSGSTPVTITYTLPTGCYKTMPVTVNQAPGAIIGPSGVCVGNSATFINPMSGGAWTSSNPSVAPIGSSSGIVPSTALPGGTITITYTWNTCPTSTTFTVIPPPAAISGPSVMCNGSCQVFTDPTPLGTWSSSFPSVATVDPLTGNVCGVGTGTTLISYGVAACVTTKYVMINPIPVITGPNIMCQGQTIMLHDTALGGTWTSLSTGVATVNPATGLVTGVGGGTTSIRYTLSSGCFTDHPITVNPAPATITGPTATCVGQMVIQSTTSTGGTWSSSTPGVGTIDPITGVLTAIAPGVTYITYTFTATGCSRTRTFTVSPIVAAINGPGSICMGSPAILYTDPTPGGIWYSSATGVATVDSITGLVSPVSLGATTLTYTVGATACYATKTITVIGGVSAITGPGSVCQGSTITLSNPSGGGTWTSSSPSTAAVGASSGDVTGIGVGIATITYSLGVGCESRTLVTVNPIPAAIVSSPNICVGSSATFTSGTPGGTWMSSDIFVASVDVTSGVVTGTGAGVAIISYILPTGCYVTAMVNVSVGPPAISGPNSFCVGGNATFYNSLSGGIWSSSRPVGAPIDSIMGVMTGISTGTALVSYTVSGFACPATFLVTINPTPGTIVGVDSICQGLNTTLTNSVPGGIWNSSNTSIAVISPATGALTAVVTGATTPTTVIIDYSMGIGAGCAAFKIITVNPLPAAIFGLDSVCSGQMIPLFDATPGGTWSSALPAVGTVDAGGVFGGVSGGVATVSYTNGYGCAATHPVTVHTSPNTIIGSDKVCLGGTTALSNTISGGIWTSSAPGIASVGASTGVVSGVALGSATITYTMPGNCAVQHNMTVNPLPLIFTVTGGGNHCAGDAGVHVYLSGSTVGVNYFLYLGGAAVGSFIGTGSPLDFGLHTVGGTYTVKAVSSSTACQVNMAGSAAIGVIPTVTPVVNLNVTPNDTVCSGSVASFTPVASFGGTAPVYSWKVNGLLVAVANSYSFIPADGDVVEVSMTSNAVCPSPATVTRTVTMEVEAFGPPTAVLALTPNDTVCRGTVVTASAVTTHAGPSPAYTWYKNGAVVSYSGASYTWPASDGDEVFVVLYSNDPCRVGDWDSSARVTETVADPVLPVIVISASKGTTIHKGESNTLTAVVTKAVKPTYQWYINGLPIAGATNVSFTATSFSYPEQDSISVAVTSHDICEVTAHEWVYMNVITTGVSQFGTGSDLVVVPNPTSGRFTVKGTLATNVDEEVSLEVTNVIGQVVYKENVTAKAGKLNHEVNLGKGLANGMYMLTLRSGSDNKVFHLVVEQ